MGCFLLSWFYALFLGLAERQAEIPSFFCTSKLFPHCNGCPRRHRNPVQTAQSREDNTVPCICRFSRNATHLALLRRNDVPHEPRVASFKKPLTGRSNNARSAAVFFQLDARGSGLLHGVPASAVLSCNRAGGLGQPIPSDGFWLEGAISTNEPIKSDSSSLTGRFCMVHPQTSTNTDQSHKSKVQTQTITS